MHPAHARQIKTGVERSLLRAGIGRAFHTRRLAEFTCGPMLKTWVQTDARSDLKQGRGWTLAGPGVTPYEVACVLARGLHTGGMACKVIPLVRLTRLVENNRLVDSDVEELQDCITCDALFVTDFFQEYPGAGSPLTAWQIATVEGFLLSRLDESRAIMPVACRWGPAMWWSGNLVQRVAKSNRLLELPA